MIEITNLYPPQKFIDIGNRQENDPPVFEEVNLYKASNALISSYGYVIKNFKIIKECVTYRHRNTVSFKNILSFSFFKKKIKIDKPCLSLAHGWYNGYYHFTLECLPKLFLLKEYIDISVVVFPAKMSSFHKQWFDILNIKNLLLIDINEVVETPMAITTNFVARDLNHHHLITPLFRDWVLSHIKNKDSINYKKVFIGRKRPNYRILINNEEVKEFLIKLGFVYVEMEDFSVEDQIKIFYNAEQIVSIHGAALSNSCFCKPQTKIIDLMHEDFKQWCYLKLSIVLDLEYTILACKGENINNKLPGFLDLDVDIESLKKIVTTWK